MLKGSLIRKDDLTQSISLVGEEIVRIIDRLSGQADSLSSTLAKDGPAGLRKALTTLSSRMRADIADVLSRLAMGPQTSEDQTTEEP